MDDDFFLASLEPEIAIAVAGCQVARMAASRRAGARSSQVDRSNIRRDSQRSGRRPRPFHVFDGSVDAVHDGHLGAGRGKAYRSRSDRPLRTPELAMFTDWAFPQRHAGYDCGTLHFTCIYPRDQLHSEPCRGLSQYSKVDVPVEES